MIVWFLNIFRDKEINLIKLFILFLESFVNYKVFFYIKLKFIFSSFDFLNLFYLRRINEIFFLFNYVLYF